jgi:predicted GIY-YIG superfamily endonuclease
MRKKRCDRNHIIYQITNQVTGEFYIGITQCIGRAILFSIKKRFNQHVSRAITQNFDWTLCNSIRQYGADNFKIKVIEIVRGKSTAHSKEVELIHELRPQLNVSSNKVQYENN